MGVGSEVIKEQNWGGHNDDFFVVRGGHIYNLYISKNITDP